MDAGWWTKPEQLDGDQKAIISLPLSGNHLVTGPPGCGKTNLLLLRATYLKRAGNGDFLVLTFGRALREFLVSGTSTTKLSPDSISTYISWACSILTGNGVKIPENPPFQELREFVSENLGGLDDNQIQDYRVGCLLIDECQDFTGREVAFFERIADQIFAVGDNRQRIYEGASVLEAFEQICGAPKVLRYHYRNGKKICHLADGLYNLNNKKGGMEATSQYSEAFNPSVVKSVENLDKDEQATAIEEQIITQLRAYPDALIGVLCPKTEDAKFFLNYLINSRVGYAVSGQLFDEGYSQLGEDTRVIVTTIHSAKGLEFQAVHLAGMESLRKFRDKQKRLAYTGITRAKASLSVYSAAEFSGAVSGALAKLRPPSAPPELDELFRSEK